MHKKTISLFLVTKTKISEKTDKSRKKPTKIGLAYVQFYKKQIYIEEERGADHMNHQKEIAKLTDF